MGTSTGTVVVVDDEVTIRKYLAEVLRLEGYDCHCFQGSLLALAYLAHCETPPDLVLTDIRMPEIDGITLLKKIRALSPALPVILISAFFEPAMALEAVQAGAADYLYKPAKPAEVLAVVGKHVRASHDARSQAVQSALAGFLAGYKPYYDSQRSSDAQPAPAEALFQALGFKRYETMQHSMRVAAYSTLLGARCGLTPPQLQDLERGALLHDIGKIAIPRNVLLKPGPLDDNEWKVMRTHPLIGYQLLAELPAMRDVAEIVYAHHERYDGRGYPRGLKGEAIPIGARLFSVVDTVDAITSDRAYRAAQGFDVAASELQKGSGTQFQPDLVASFLQIPESALFRIRAQYPDLS